MTATQFTGGSYKHVDPSNYNTGKQGAEVTIHWSVAEGAPVEEQRAIGEAARVEAIRLALGAEKPPYPVVDFTGQPPEAGTVAYARVAPVPPTPPVAVVQPATPIVEPQPTSSDPIATTAASHSEAAPLPLAVPVGPPATPTSSGPLSAPGPTVAPVADTSAPAASTTSPSPASEPISDQTLAQKAQETVKALMDKAGADPVAQELAGGKVTALIAEYVQKPKTLYAIGQDKRQEFLDRLANL